MISKSKLEKKLKRKSNPLMRKLIAKLKSNKNWYEVAVNLVKEKRKSNLINLGDLDKKIKEGEIVLFPGKVLSEGKISKKITLIAKAFSAEAEKKLKEEKIDYMTIESCFEKNPKIKFRIIQ